MALTKIPLVLLLCLFGFFYSKTAKSQYCGCSPILCCSQHGYCGISDDHCVTGCRSGPCRKGREPVDRIVTQKFFDRIISEADNRCPGKSFYTRDAFLEAVKTNSNFTRSVTRLEIATMFAHFSQETQNFCYIEEVNGGSADYCDQNNMNYPCVPGKEYYGRGPIQLAWNYNYGAYGQSLGLDLLRQPELVATNATVAFGAALWIWINNVRPVLNQGFGATIRAINMLECNGRDFNARMVYYRSYCRQLGVEPSTNITC